jgi:hypothetical protein
MILRQLSGGRDRGAGLVRDGGIEPSQTAGFVHGAVRSPTRVGSLSPHFFSA